METNQLSNSEVMNTKTKEILIMQKPTSAFIGAAWFTLLTGMVSYCIGLWNAQMQLNEKGYYFTILLFVLMFYLFYFIYMRNFKLCLKQHQIIKDIK